jgi:YggT family protein
MNLLAVLIDVYSLVVLAAVVLSWMSIDPRHPAVQAIERLVEPALAPIRRALPSMGGIDFSPMVLLLVLRLIRGAL